VNVLRVVTGEVGSNRPRLVIEQVALGDHAAGIVGQ
jgi:hypothetical protein